MTTAPVLVTGAGGFLGLELTRQLVAAGYSVRTLQRGDYPELAALGVEVVRGDLLHRPLVDRACAGCSAVFHVAAKPGIWGREADYVAANVTATDNVIAACRAAGVPRLVFTSSPSVTFDGGDQPGVDESAPYPTQFLSAYSRTKAEAERRVLAAHGDDLRTAALRPHLIWGPGDRHLIPRLLEKARRGRLRQVGDGKNRVDAVYIENAARAHLLAHDALADGRCGGNAYFVTNDEPVNLWQFIGRILEIGGVPPLTKRISAAAAYRIGAVLEGAWTLTGRRSEPPMTRFVARQLATDHWFDTTAARRDLNYRPAVSMDEGLERLAAWLKSSGVGPTK